MYIKELEDRETVLAQNVEELLKEIKEVEEDVVRWREACELEVEAGKNVIEERDKVVTLSFNLESAFDDTFSVCFLDDSIKWRLLAFV